MTDTTPPNILFVMADQLTPFMMGAYGNQATIAPTLDRLAGEGVAGRDAATGGLAGGFDGGRGGAGTTVGEGAGAVAAAVDAIAEAGASSSGTIKEAGAIQNP